MQDTINSYIIWIYSKFKTKAKRPHADFNSEMITMTTSILMKHPKKGTHHQLQQENCSPEGVSCWCAGLSWAVPVGCSPLHTPKGNLDPHSMEQQGGLLPPCGGKRVVRRRGREKPHLPGADGLCLFAGIQFERGVAGIPCCCEDGVNGSCPPVKEQWENESKKITSFSHNKSVWFSMLLSMPVLLVGMSMGPLVGLASGARRTGGGLRPCNPCSSELDQVQNWSWNRPS